MTPFKTKVKKSLSAKIITPDISIFQSSPWSEFKLKSGYQKSYYVMGILILIKQIPLGFSMLYAPMVRRSQIQSLNLLKFTNEIKKIAKKDNAIFFRFELDIPKENEKYFYDKLKVFDFQKSFEEMQPCNNWLIDLSADLEKIFEGMKQKGRYNIRQGEKHQLNVKWSNEKTDLNIFYHHYESTGKRHKISYRQKSYFDHLIDILGKMEYARVYTAWKDKQSLASAIVLYYNEEALYLYGGSSDQMKEVMAPYYMQWQIIKDAKGMGMKTYNMLGVAPDDDPNHPWAGLTAFKKRFGGYQHDIIGCLDLPISPICYLIFKNIEKVRRK